MASNPATEAMSINSNRTNAGLSSGSIQPVIVVNMAPPVTIIAPKKPAALPASFGFTDMVFALLPGMEIPFPSPTNMVAVKNKTGVSCSIIVMEMPIKSPEQATSLPMIIKVSALYLRANRPARKLPVTNPQVIVPI